MEERQKAEGERKEEEKDENRVESRESLQTREGNTKSRVFLIADTGWLAVSTSQPNSSFDFLASQARTSLLAFSSPCGETFSFTEK